LRISRQAYYQQWKRQHNKDEHEGYAIEFVKSQRLIHPRIGTRKLQYLMGLNGLRIGRDHLFSVLKQQRLLVSTKRAYHKTTNSHHRFHRHPNLIKDGFKATRPEQLWVADITYLPTHNGDTYLSLVTDAYSRKIVGHYIDTNMKTHSVKKAFTRALRARKSVEQLIHHSDRGIQYCSGAYQKIHERYGVQCSMTDGYDCYQNALAERINGILKNEYLLYKPNDIDEARKMVEESVLIYNQQRPHTALKYKTPDEIHRAF
jgi:putative transposase